MITSVLTRRLALLTALLVALAGLSAAGWAEVTVQVAPESGNLLISEPEVTAQPITVPSQGLRPVVEPEIDAAAQSEITPQPVVEVTAQPEITPQPEIDAAVQPEITPQPVAEVLDSDATPEFMPTLEPELTVQPVVEPTPVVVISNATPVPSVDMREGLGPLILTRCARFNRVAASVDNSAWVDGLGRPHVVGSNEYGQCDVEGWPKITAIALGDRHAVGLTEAGTLVFAGSNEMGQCTLDTGNVPVIAIAASPYATFALLQNGGLRMCGAAQMSNDDFAAVEGAIRVSASDTHVAVLKADGTVLAFGNNARGACDTGAWKDIVMVACGFDFTIACDKAGTVYVIGSNDYGQAALDGLTTAYAVAAGQNTCFAILANGHVKAAGSNSMGQLDVGLWRNCVGIAAGYRHTIGINTKGIIYGAGDTEYGKLKLN